MDWIVSIIVGALIGWIASRMMKTDEQQGVLGDVVVGIVGSLLGVWLFSGVLGIGSAATAGSLSIMGIVWGVLGAAILIAILKALKVLK